METNHRLCNQSQNLMWKQFIDCGKIESGLPSLVADSWQRCSQLQVNPNDGKGYNVLEYQDVKQLLEKKREIIDIAKPFMVNLYQFFRNSQFIVVLADEFGYVLENFGDYSSLVCARNLCFIQGASWREVDVGTNAISLVLQTGKANQITGAEHYCMKHHHWTCSAAPIYGSDGRMVAVLDLSGPFQSANSHTLAMIAAASKAIAVQISLQLINQELFSARGQLTNIFNSISEGVLVVNRLGIVRECNSKAISILGKPEYAIRDIPVEKIFVQNIFTQKILWNMKSFSNVELFVENQKDMRHCLVSNEPIINHQGLVDGSVMILRPIEKVRSLAANFNGCQAMFQFADIIGQSSQMKECIRVAFHAAESNSYVLLQGESGTGKELFAQAVHNRSGRRGSFIAINCGAIPHGLIANELFGYVEGAFTGAKRGGCPGKFELSSGGTLFLDEIGEMPVEQQVALLRVLEEKTVTRIGGNQVIPVEVRVICATNKNLLQEVNKGLFRRDLYYRLNVIQINIPPLRERREDIEPLFRYFLEQWSQEKGCSYRVEQAVLDYLKRYDWPGNVRELHNVTERMVNLIEGEVLSVACLPQEILMEGYKPETQSEMLVPAVSVTVKDLGNRDARKKILATRERLKILSLLEQYGGNISQVAVEMNIARSTLYRKLKVYHIEN